MPLFVYDGKSPDQIAALLDAVAHAATSHEAIATVLSPTDHSSVDHSGLTGVQGSFRILDKQYGLSHTKSFIVPGNTLLNGDELLIEAWVGNAVNITGGTLTFGGVTLATLTPQVGSVLWVRAKGKNVGGTFTGVAYGMRHDGVNPVPFMQYFASAIDMTVNQTVTLDVTEVGAPNLNNMDIYRLTAA